MSTLGAGNGEFEPPGTGARPPTVSNPAGPAYRPGAPFRDELALGRRGERLRLDGHVLRPDGTPVRGAVVDLWHAGPCGCYDLFDPRMRFRGRIRATAEGCWTVWTVCPGGYLWRPPHVHVRVWIEGRLVLTTQLYLPGDVRLHVDPWVCDELLLELVPDGRGWAAHFDLVVPADHG